MRHGADAHLHEIALVAERLVLEQDFLDHLLRAADGEMAAQLRPASNCARVVGGQPRSRPMRRHLRGVARKELVGGLLRGVGDIAVGVDADRQMRRRRARPRCAACAIEFDERRETAPACRR